MKRSAYIKQDYHHKKMKSYCVKDHLTGHIYKVLFTEEEFQDFLKRSPDIGECIDCIECDDAPSICIE
jgi:hypothetical protein